MAPCVAHYYACTFAYSLPFMNTDLIRRLHAGCNTAASPGQHSPEGPPAAQHDAIRLQLLQANAAAACGLCGGASTRRKS